MLFIKSNILSLAALLATSATAHMILKEPAPYGTQSKEPLAPNGSDFPCKGIPYTVNSMNEWPVGSTQKLAFTGTATHGGGSCQVSVTTDKEPTTASKWKVIHSFEGGCVNSFKGNLAEGGPDSDTTFPFQVPSELPNGELTMAWTWFNHIGNREMYMACAPISVSGGASDTKEFEALPDMAIANIAVPGSCGTTEPSFDYNFANPGKYVTKGGDSAFKPLCANQAPAGNGGESAAPPAASPIAAPVAPSPSQAPGRPSSAEAQTSTLRTIVIVTASMGPPKTSQGGAFTGSGALAPAPTPTSSTPQAPAPTPISSTPQAPAAPAPVPAPGGPNGTSSVGSTCSPDGSIVCSADGTQFALCNFGSAIFQPVAAGTKCTNGAIGKRDFTHRAQRTAI